MASGIGKSRVLALFYEDLDSDPQDYLDSICSFIGVRCIALDRSIAAGAESLFGSDRSAHQCDWAAHLHEGVHWVSRHGAQPLV